MSLANKLNAVQRKIRSEGVLGTLRTVADHLTRPLLARTEILYYADLPTYAVDPTALSPGFSAVPYRGRDEVPAADWVALLDYSGTSFEREILGRLAAGWELWLARIAGEPAGGMWVVPPTADLRTKVVPLLDTDAALVDAFTYPGQRGKNVYPALLAIASREYARRGFLRCWGYVNVRNAASIRGLAKAALVPAREYECYRFGSREVVVWKEYRRPAPGAKGREPLPG